MLQAASRLLSSSVHGVTTVLCFRTTRVSADDVANLYCYAVVPNPANESIINPKLSLFLDSAVYGYQVRVFMQTAACCTMPRHATPGCRYCLHGPGSPTHQGQSLHQLCSMPLFKPAASMHTQSMQLQLAITRP